MKSTKEKKDRNEDITDDSSLSTIDTFLFEFERARTLLADDLR